MLQIDMLSFLPVLRLHTADGENKDGPIVRYEILDKPFLTTLRGVYIVTKNETPVYCGKITNTFAKRWLYTKGQYVYHFKRGIIAAALIQQHELVVYAQEEDTLRNQLGYPGNVWISATSIEEKLIRDPGLRQQWNAVG